MKKPNFTDAWAVNGRRYRNSVETDLKRTFRQASTREQVSQAEQRISGKRFCLACQVMRDALTFKKTRNGNYRCADCVTKARG